MNSQLILYFVIKLEYTMSKSTLLFILFFIELVGNAQENCVYMASDLYPGSYGALPVGITEFNGALYFRATGNSAGPELWKYENGASSMVADLNPGIGGSMPNQFTVIGSTMYFTATTAATGMELYKFDGVSISLAADIYPGANGSSLNFLTAIGSELYFSANDGVSGNEPWKYDGVTATQVADVNPGIGDSNPDEFAGAGGYIYFTGLNPLYGFELWKYDGVTAVVEDLYPGTTGSDLGELTPIGSKICFRATNGTQGYELWVHDGVSPVCLDVCTVGAGDFTPWEFTTFGTEVFFRGFISGSGYELWKYDGTNAVLVADIFSGAGNGHPNHMVAGNSILYFAANNGTAGNELWMYDGSNASLVGDINPGSNQSIPYAVTEKFITVGDDLIFIADNGSLGNEVWRFDGVNLELAKDIIVGNLSSTPSGLTHFGNSVYFMADDQIHGGELWKWDLDQVLTQSLVVVTCDDYLSPAGSLYNVEGVYSFTDTLSSVNCPGCDSLININLTISSPDTSLLITNCNDYTSPAGDYYNVLGNYLFTDTIPSIACPGVDSLIHIDLTITDHINLSIFDFSGVVFVNQSGGTYQWLDCDNGYSIITGETDQDYLPPISGNYCCVITIGSCMDTTNCIFVESSTAGTFNPNTSKINVYPNPVISELNVEFNSNSHSTLKLYNNAGIELIYTKVGPGITYTINMSDYTSGLYFLEIMTQSGLSVRKIIKN